MANTGAVFPNIVVKDPVIVFRDKNHNKLEKVIKDPAINTFDTSLVSLVFSNLCFKISLNIPSAITLTIALIIVPVNILLSIRALSLKKNSYSPKASCKNSSEYT